MSKPKKTIVYIDGFNLYYGMKSRKWEKYLWLDLAKFSDAINPPNHKVVVTNYFTSRIKGLDDPEKPKRQSMFLDAVETLKPAVEPIFGTYQAFQSHCKYCNNYVTCPHCNKPHVKPNEKKTDVNIATVMLVDAFEEKCDTQILVSGDGDYENLLIELRRLFPEKSLIVAFPPKRRNNSLIGINKCTDTFTIKKNAFSNSQFPRRIVFQSKGKKVILDKPSEWT